MTILETYTEVTGSLVPGSDGKLHFVDGFGEAWHDYGTSYGDDNPGIKVYADEKLDDGDLSELCPGCKEAADEEED